MAQLKPANLYDPNTLLIQFDEFNFIYDWLSKQNPLPKTI